MGAPVEGTVVGVAGQVRRLRPRLAAEAEDLHQAAVVALASCNRMGMFCA